MRKLFPLTFCLLFLFVPASVRAGDPILRPADRVIFIGDSITARGGLQDGTWGWVALINRALKEKDAANKQTLVTLGGSGQTVESWLNIETNSRTAPTFLDLKAFDVQAELGRPADVVVIMLGMNEVGAPRIQDVPESYAKWIGNYRTLIKSVRERTSPRVVILATPTPCTENPESPKNQVLDKMVAELKKMAKEDGCLVAPTRDTAWAILHQGRRERPDFHITDDQIHPNPIGCMAIAAGMLRGLGEEDAAKNVLEKLSAETREKSPQGLSYEVSLTPDQKPSPTLQFRIRAYHSKDKAELDLPEGWKIASTKSSPGETEFTVTGAPDHLINRIGLRAGQQSFTIQIPAPWLVGTGNVGWQGWHGGTFDPQLAKLPTDDVIRTGTGIAEAMAHMELKAGVPVTWKIFVEGINSTGAGDPGALDFSAVTYYLGGEVGYGLRWISSDRDRPVTVKASRIGKPALAVWLNGESVFSNESATSEIKSTLKKGWNLLSFKSNYQAWGWQFAINLKPAEGDNLDDLRYSATPR